MNTKHTPGPWHLDCRSNEAPCIVREPEKPAGSLDEWMTICQVYGPSPLREANGRLIRLAPELAHALRGMLQAIEAMPPDYQDAPYMWSRTSEARAVLAKLDAP